MAKQVLSLIEIRNQARAIAKTSDDESVMALAELVVDLTERVRKLGKSVDEAAQNAQQAKNQFTTRRPKT